MYFRWLNLLIAGAAVVLADDDDHIKQRTFKYVTVFSVDGLHSSDIPRWISHYPHGALAGLLKTGYWYKGALTSAPSDSFPGTMNLVTGASPKTSKIWYDVAYDRDLYPPGTTKCTGPKGTVVAFDESIDYDNTKLFSGTPNHNAFEINPTLLPVTPNGCKPLYPHQRLAVNTIFNVVHDHAHLQTAYADKHPSYDIVRGPSGTGLSVGYFPEIQSYDSTNIPEIITYDGFHVASWVAWIKGQVLANTEIQEPLTGMPTLFGGNFQAVSVGQKAVSGGYVPKGSDFDFSPLLLTSAEFVDDSLGYIVGNLTHAGKLDDTLIIVCSKHGQAPINKALYTEVDDGTIVPATGLLPSQITVTADDIGLLWLTDPSLTNKAVQGLQAHKAALKIQEIIYGEELIDRGYGDPKTNSATPDIIIVPELGVTYTTSTSKIAEHGGFSNDDRNVACFASNPSLKQKVFTRQVSSAQVAPTVLRALGLDLGLLDSVNIEHTDVLPGFDGEDGDGDGDFGWHF